MATLSEDIEQLRVNWKAFKKSVKETPEGEFVAKLILWLFNKLTQILKS